MMLVTSMCVASSSLYRCFPSLAAQGELITTKLLSLGGTAERRLVRRWLVNTAQLPTGEVFSNEGELLHMGSDGKWEANAEFILSAAS